MVWVNNPLFKCWGPHTMTQLEKCNDYSQKNSYTVPDDKINRDISYCAFSGIWWCIAKFFISRSMGHPQLCCHSLTVNRPWRMVHSLRKVGPMFYCEGICVLLLTSDYHTLPYHCCTAIYRYVYLNKSYMLHLELVVFPTKVVARCNQNTLCLST